MTLKFTTNSSPAMNWNIGHAINFTGPPQALPLLRLMLRLLQPLPLLSLLNARNVSGVLEAAGRGPGASTGTDRAWWWSTKWVCARVPGSRRQYFGVLSTAASRQGKPRTTDRPRRQVPRERETKGDQEAGRTSRASSEAASLHSPEASSGGSSVIGQKTLFCQAPISKCPCSRWKTAAAVTCVASASNRNPAYAEQSTCHGGACRRHSRQSACCPRVSGGGQQKKKESELVPKACGETMETSRHCPGHW